MTKDYTGHILSSISKIFLPRSDKLEKTNTVYLEMPLKKFITITLLVLASSSFANNMAGLKTVTSADNVKIAKESSVVRDIVEQTERIHSVKCGLKSITTSVGDHFLKYKCKNSKRKIKLVIRTRIKKDTSSVKNYKVFFKN